jgi:DNA repair exonuclease SbcCD ATPase subunit
MIITKLVAENFKILKAVEITPEKDGVVIVSGKNGSGKTSVLDAIALAVAGKKFAPQLTNPIRNGEKKASVTVETDNGLIITRSWTQNGTPGTLTLRDNEGRKYSSPQEFLDGLIGNIAFDPLSFANAKQSEQKKILLGLVGIDIDSIDEERKSVFEKRTEINRDVKRAKMNLESMEEPEEEINDEFVNIDELTKKYKESVKKHQDLEKIDSEVIEFKEKIQSLKNKLQEYENRVIGLEALKEKELESLLENKELSYPEKILGKINNAEKINEKIRNAKSFKKAKEEMDSLSKQSEELTIEIEKIDKKKIDLLESANFPISGLGFSEDGITYKGIPFPQCCMSEQLKVSIAIAMRLNPEFRVIRVTDASLLDSDNMKVIEALAKKHQFQVWMEVVNAQNGVGVIIKDGMIESESITN